MTFFGLAQNYNKNKITTKKLFYSNPVLSFSPPVFCFQINSGRWFPPPSAHPSGALSCMSYSFRWFHCPHPLL